jgi:AcrR family transcriptional regulator
MGPAERREQILAVAARHFEQRSYSEVSTYAIAEDAGVGRPLIHYYFGTKRDLYLEVVRRLAMVPPDVPAAAVRGIAEDALEERIHASIDYWLSVTSRHQSMWTSTISFDAPTRDREIAQIIEQADEIAADRMLEALGLTTHPQRKRLHAMFLAFGGLARAAAWQWLERKALTREEVTVLLSQSLLTIIKDIAPQFDSRIRANRRRFGTTPR